MSVYEETPFFRLREFKKKDFYRLTEIARAINRKALRCQKQGYFPFYAFQVDQTVSDVDTILRKKVQIFLEKAQKERSVWPRSTYRLAVENQKGDLIGNVTVDMLPILEDGKIIITHITHEQARRQRAHFNDYMGIINKLSSISGSKLVLFVYPREDEYYVSMRADVGYDVAIIAKKYGGGGHAGAAAYISDKDLKEIEKEVLVEFFNQIKKSTRQSSKIF